MLQYVNFGIMHKLVVEVLLLQAATNSPAQGDGTNRGRDFSGSLIRLNAVNGSLVTPCRLLGYVRQDNDKDKVFNYGFIPYH